MLRKAAGVAVCLALAACQTTKVALNDTVTPLQGKSITVVQHPEANFFQKSMGSAILGPGALSWAIEQSGGSELKKKSGMTDPAPGLADSLAQKLAGKYGMQRLPGKGVTKSIRPAALVTENPGADYIVDVTTMNWALMPTSFSQYSLVYSAEFKLIAATTKLPVAKALCTSGHSDPVKAPTKEEFLMNDGALLRDYTAKAAARCLDEWSQQLLMLGGAPQIAAPAAAPSSPAPTSTPPAAAPAAPPPA